MAAIDAHKTWRTLEAVHGHVYFAPEASAAYAELGLEPTAGYFASRAASLGPVDAEPVIAMFYNFNPSLIRSALPRAWEIASPQAVHTARVDAAGRGLRRVLDGVVDPQELAEAAALATEAAQSCVDDVSGRPLFAAHTTLGWPDDPLLVLWHAQMLLREYRGDGHVAVLTAHGISGLEALILHAATGAVSRLGLQATRAWSDDAWDGAVQRLVGTGLVHADGSFTEAGTELRRSIEERTDELATAPYDALGPERCTRLRELVRPWSRLLSADMVNRRPAPREG